MSVIETVENVVEVAAGEGAWIAAMAGQRLKFGSRIRTGEFSRATVRLPNGTLLRVGELTTITLQPPKPAAEKATIDLLKGALYFFNKSKIEPARIKTPVATGAVKGTEFEVHLNEEGASVWSVIDGEVAVSGVEASLDLSTGEQGVIDPQRGSAKTSNLHAVNVMQWAPQYPVVVDPGDLRLERQGKKRREESLEAYGRGNVLPALAAYNEIAGSPDSQSERVYLASLYLAAGQAVKAELLLQTDQAKVSPVALALKELMTVVKGGTPDTAVTPQTPSQWMARSYYHQGLGDLKAALTAANRAIEQSPEFGFGWSRAAELRFGFGHRKKRARR